MLEIFAEKWLAIIFTYEMSTFGSIRTDTVHIYLCTGRTDEQTSLGIIYNFSKNYLLNVNVLIV
jgi:hypothetical protein